MNRRTVFLKPCANCGSHDVDLLRTVGDRMPKWHVECADCGMQTTHYPEPCEAVANADDVTDAIDDAIECCVDAWNTRTYDKHCDDDCDKHCDDDSVDYLGMNKFIGMLDNLCKMAHSLGERHE